MDTEGLEIWKAMRPTDFSRVVGQEPAVRVLQKFVKDKALPHAVLLSGPPGVGKTTIARILAGLVGCHEAMLQELNCAIREPMDTIRKIESTTSYAPMMGGSRVWILDEFQTMSRAKFSQQSLLKIIEDTGQYNYYFLCATDVGKILPAVKSRCTPIVLGAIKAKDLANLIGQACKSYNLDLDQEVINAVIELSDGGARTALKLAESVGRLPTKAEQLQCLRKSDQEIPAVELARALLDSRAAWPQVARILSSLKETGEDAEGLRRMILAYFSKIVLGGGKLAPVAFRCGQIFRDHLYDSGFDGLILNCWWYKKAND